MNNYSFRELAKGVYGRKIAYTDVDEITEDNVLKVLGDTIGIFYYNKSRVKYLWDYKNGDQPVQYRTKTIRDDVCNVVTENHAWEIVRFKNGQTFGEPVQLVSNSEDENVNKAVEELNKLLAKSHKQRKDLDSGEWTSAVGTGFKAVQIKRNGKIPFGISIPTPLNTYIVYSSKTGEAMLAVQELKDEKGERYFLCFSDTHEYRVQNSKLLPLITNSSGSIAYSRLHIFGGLPIVEYPNNQCRVSDIELVIDMLDAINNMQSNRMDAIEQFVQSWVKFVNCEIDSDTFKQMKMEGALVVKSNNGTDNKADVDIMTQELNQQQTQIAKDDIWDNILSIEAIPSKQGNSGGDTQGAVELRNGWDFSKTAAMIKDAYISEAETELCDRILNVIHVERGNSYLPISTMDFDVKITHSPTDALYTKTQSLQLLLSAGIHPLVAITTCGLWSDVEKVFNMSKPYMDNLYKTIDQALKESEMQLEMEKAKALLANGNNNEPVQ